MYSINIRKSLNLGIFHLLLIDKNDDDNYQIFLISLILILMTLMLIIVESTCWKISKVKMKRIYHLFIHLSFIFEALICPVIYRLFGYKKTIYLFYGFGVFGFALRLLFSFSIYFIWAFFIIVLPWKLAIELNLALGKSFIDIFKKLFGYEKIGDYGWYFVGLKNENESIYYLMLNYLKKVIYLIPIYGILISMFIWEDYKRNVVHVLAMIIIWSIEVIWLAYICKVYPYESLSHNRIIIVNQISVVLISILGVVTVKLKPFKLN